MLTRSSAIEKILGLFLVSAYILYVIPLWHPSNILASSVFLGGLLLIAWAMGKFLSGEQDRMMLVVVALVVVGEIVLFTLTPVGA